MAALTAALLGLSAVSQYAQQRKQGEYQASALDTNAGLADERAADALQRGKEAQRNQVLGTKQLLGSNRSGFAGQGVQVDNGSALDVQADTAQLGELDRLMIEHNAMRESMGYKTDATILRNQGEQVRSASRNAATGTLLSAASQLYSVKSASDANNPKPKKSGSMIASRGWGG